MAIHMYTGRPGAGKSYGVVENVVLPCAQSGRLLVTNMPLELERLQSDFPSFNCVVIDPTPRDQSDLDLEKHPERAGAVFLLDEIWKIWPADTRANSIPESSRSFFAEHRHHVGQTGLSTEICLVVQSIANVAPYVRELIDTTYLAENLTPAGQKNRYRVDVYTGPQYLNRVDDRAHIRSLMGSYKKKVYQYYKSHTKNISSFTAGMEEIVDKRNNVFGSPIFRYGIPAAVVLLLVGGWNTLDFFNGPDHDQANASPVESGDHQPVISPFDTRPALIPTNRETIPTLSENWRIAGIATNAKGNGWAVLEDLAGMERTIPIRQCKRVHRTQWEWECAVDGETATFYSGKTNTGARTLL